MTPDRRPPVLLDFGGTLDSAGKHWSTQFADSFAEAGIPFGRAELDAAFLAADRAMNDAPSSATLPFAAYVLEYARRMLSALGRAPRDSEGHASTIAGHFMREALGHLRRSSGVLALHRHRFRYAVVSNFTANLPRIVEEVGLAEAVDHVSCSAIEGVRKPDSAIFRRTLAGLGIDADELDQRAGVTMIGDSLANDIVPAKALGFTTVWLRGDLSYGGGGERAAADHVVASLAEAFEILCGGNSASAPASVSASVSAARGRT